MPIKPYLPNLKSLQALEAFGRLGSVTEAAKELQVTTGAVSQRLKTLEGHLGISLVVKDGRRASLTIEAKTYCEFINRGFEQFRDAQRYLSQKKSHVDLTISGLPTLLLKWLNPNLHRFQVFSQKTAKEPFSLRLEATHTEPDALMLEHMFRLTYGEIANRYAHSRELFKDCCFPVCSPEFLQRHPEALDPKQLINMPLIEIDWGISYSMIPHWSDWFVMLNLPEQPMKPMLTHSLSSMALEAAIDGQGIVLAQHSFASVDIELGRLQRLSEHTIQMPEAYSVSYTHLTLPTTPYV